MNPNSHYVHSNQCPAPPMADGQNVQPVPYEPQTVHPQQQHLFQMQVAPQQAPNQTYTTFPDQSQELSRGSVRTETQWRVQDGEVKYMSVSPYTGAGQGFDPNRMQPPSHAPPAQYAPPQQYAPPAQYAPQPQYAPSQQYAPQPHYAPQPQYTLQPQYPLQQLQYPPWQPQYPPPQPQYPPPQPQYAPQQLYAPPQSQYAPQDSAPQADYVQPQHTAQQVEYDSPEPRFASPAPSQQQSAPSYYQAQSPAAENLPPTQSAHLPQSTDDRTLEPAQGSIPASLPQQPTQSRPQLPPRHNNNAPPRPASNATAPTVSRLRAQLENRKINRKADRAKDEAPGSKPDRQIRLFKYMTTVSFWIESPAPSHDQNAPPHAEGGIFIEEAPDQQPDAAGSSRTSFVDRRLNT